MYTVMLIDDEPLILEKLTHLIAWEAHACQIIAALDKSTTALELAREIKPQIIFSDIQMPHLNGLELAQQLQKELPESLVILISGYNEFAYAQVAISSGVFRYLLKPLTPEALIEVLKEAQQTIALRQAAFSERLRLQALVKASLPRLQEKFFTDLLQSELLFPDLQAELDFLELNLNSSTFGVILISLDNYHELSRNLNTETLQLTKFQLIELLNNALADQASFHYLLFHKPSELVLICGLTSSQSEEQLYQTLLELQQAFQAKSSFTFSAGLGSFSPELTALRTSYQEALLALEFKVWAGQNALIPYQDLARSHAGQLLNMPEHDRFTALLREADLSGAHAYLKKFFTSLQQAKPVLTKNLLHLAVVDLINQLIHTLLEFNAPLEEVFLTEVDPLAWVSQAETVSQLVSLVETLTQQAIAFIAHYKQDLSKNFVEKAKTYLEKNYQNPELNLNELATHVYVSSCYLSHLFRQVTGSTISEYLNKIRIRASQRLLKETQLKIYEIAEQVGFNDSHYFGIVFKKTTGLSALEYRDKVQLDNLL